MLAYIEGEIISKNEKGIILKTNQLGYFIHLPTPILEKVQIGENSNFYLHQQLKEDSSDLYGFTDFQTLNFFKTVISVNGIGPRTGLEILALPTDKVKSAIITEDENYICKIPGIGKKTAKRLILELKEKIDIDIQKLSPLESEKTESNIDYSIEEETFDALIKLGYQRSHISETLKKAPKTLTTTEDLITYFIKNA